MADWQGEMDIKIIDLTRRLSDGTEGYPGDHVGLSVAQLAQVESDGYNFSSFSHLEAHCGTHIDSPLHFVADGIDIASLPLQAPLGLERHDDHRGRGAPADLRTGATGRLNRNQTGFEWEIGEDVSGVSVVRLSYWIEPYGVYRYVQRLTGGSRWYTRQMRRAVRRLRDLIEAERTATEKIEVAGGNRYQTGIL